MMMTFTTDRGHGGFGRRFVPLLGAGLLGVVALVGASAPALRELAASGAGATALPLPALVVLSAAQLAVPLAAATALGVALAGRLGLRSRVAERAAEGTPLWPGLRRELPLAGGIGVAAGLAMAGFDLATRSLLPPVREGSGALVAALSHTSVSSVLGALVYGGITEELLLRWGLMTGLAWLGWRVAQRRRGVPRPAIMWAAIGGAALFFGLGHLGAAAAVYGLTPFVVARTLLLNGLFGLAAGWLYWRRSLEAAMAAHMASHLVLTVVNLALAIGA